jgi:NADH-quinone oxidoreductase subunit L
VIRRLQTGYVYTYAFTMIIGVVLLLTLWFTFP